MKKSNFYKKFTFLSVVASNVTFCASYYYQDVSNTAHVQYGPQTKTGVIYSPQYAHSLPSSENNRGCHFSIQGIRRRVYVKITTTFTNTNLSTCPKTYYDVISNDDSKPSLLFNTGDCLQNTDSRYSFNSTAGGYTNTGISFTINSDDINKAARYIINYTSKL